MTRQKPAARGAAPLRRRNRLVQTSAHLVRPLALHYSRCSGECSDDLVQVGQLGLIRAAELYEGSREIPFEVFARPHIRGAILHHLRDVAPLVRLPRRQAELRDRIGRLQGDRQVAASLESLGISPETWHLLQRHRQMNRPLPLEPEMMESLGTPARGSGDAETPATGSSGATSGVEALLEELEPRQQLVVRQVVLGGQSYRQVALQLRVSPVTVRRLLQCGLETLRQALSQKPGAAEAAQEDGSPPSRSI